MQPAGNDQAWIHTPTSLYSALVKILTSTEYFEYYILSIRKKLSEMNKSSKRQHA